MILFPFCCLLYSGLFVVLLRLVYFIYCVLFVLLYCVLSVLLRLVCFIVSCVFRCVLFVLLRLVCFIVSCLFVFLCLVCFIVSYLLYCVLSVVLRLVCFIVFCLFHVLCSGFGGSCFFCCCLFLQSRCLLVASWLQFPGSLRVVVLSTWFGDHIAGPVLPFSVCHVRLSGQRVAWLTRT